MKNLLLFSSIILASQIFAQDIKVYFNQSVDNSISIYTDAQTSSNLDDTICKLIDMATTTLDIAVWDNGNDQIVNCINDAYDRGVQVRYITSSNSINSALSGLNSNIPVLERNSGISSDVMHNKFVIVDETYLLTGSMNFGDGAIFDDYNNIVLIHDASMALTYTIEFNEMWGSTGAAYNLTNSKFGPDKSNNTPHSIVIGGVEVESYFSPTDQTTAEIIQEIDSAEYTLDIAMFTFINNDISDAVIAAHNRGVVVRCIIENVGYIGSEYNNLISAGITVFSHDGVQYDFHHKYCIVDAKHVDSNPTVVTGSHNWTNSAEVEYDENTLMIHDPMIAWQYLEEFGKRWTDLGGVLNTKDLSQQDFSISPNPSTGKFTIQTPDAANYAMTIFTASGQFIYQSDNLFSGQEHQLQLQSGVYFLMIESIAGIQQIRLVIQ